MRWTLWSGWVAALGLLSGCVYGYRTVGVEARYSSSSRPDGSYYCYDCHGYRYFDPYYDWCVNYGFRYRWSDHPRAVAVYRERYVRIKENHPDYGRYRYRMDYRRDPRYRDDRDYETWRETRPHSPSDRDGARKVRKGDRESRVPRGKGHSRGSDAPRRGGRPEGA